MKEKSIFKTEISFGGVGLSAKALFAKHLALMLRSGLTITEALSIAHDSSQGALGKAIGGVMKSVESGRSLSASFGDYPRAFSPLLVHATYAGEASGTLPENFEAVAEELEKEKELVSKIQGAMVYPIVVLAGTFVLGLWMAFFILPKIVPLFEGLRVNLPPTTRALIKISHFIEERGLYLLPGIIGFGSISFWLLGQRFTEPFTHWFWLHLPIVKKITRASNLARFSRTLGTLLKSGINIDEAVIIAKNSMGNYYYRKSLGEVGVHVRKGSKLSLNLEEFPRLFPVIVTRMIKVGEESGKFEETLFYLAGYYEVEVDTATKGLSTAIEPILLIFIGLLVGGLALAIITPIYEISGNIRR